MSSSELTRIAKEMETVAKLVQLQARNEAWGGTGGRAEEIVTRRVR